MNDKLEILVVEDSPKHIESARNELSSEGNLTIVSTYKEAIEYLNKQKADVVLTDERIPFSKARVYPLTDKSFTGLPLPLGSKVVLYAIAKKVPYVALITDADHHSDEIAATLDDFVLLCREGMFTKALRIGDTDYLQHFGFCQEGVKKFAGAFNTLLHRPNGVF